MSFEEGYWFRFWIDKYMICTCKGDCRANGLLVGHGTSGIVGNRGAFLPQLRLRSPVACVYSVALLLI